MTANKYLEFLTKEKEIQGWTMNQQAQKKMINQYIIIDNGLKSSIIITFLNNTRKLFCN